MRPTRQRGCRVNQRDWLPSDRALQQSPESGLTAVLAPEARHEHVMVLEAGLLR